MFPKFLNSRPPSEVSVKMDKIYPIVLTIVICAQASYYRSYYNQPLNLSIIWAVVDWSLWFIIIYGLTENKIFNQFRDDYRKMGIALALFALVLPLFHVILSELTYSLIFNPSVSLTDDISEHFLKKWFQDILIVVGLVFGFNFINQFSRKTNPACSENSLQSEPIFLKDGGKIIRIQPEEIEWITSAKNYKIIKSQKGEIIVRVALRDIFKLFERHGFIKISRSTIINKNQIASIEKKSKYGYFIMTHHGKEFPISRTYRKSIISLVSSYLGVK